MISSPKTLRNITYTVPILFLSQNQILYHNVYSGWSIVLLAWNFCCVEVLHTSTTKCLKKCGTSTSKDKSRLRLLKMLKDALEPFLLCSFTVLIGLHLLRTTRVVANGFFPFPRTRAHSHNAMHLSHSLTLISLITPLCITLFTFKLSA